MWKVELTSDKLGCLDKECVHAKSFQLCPILCNPMDCSLPGSSVHRILQARILEWVAMPSSRGSSQPRDRNARGKNKLKERLNKKEPEFEELGNFLVAQLVKNLPTMEETQV